MNELQAVDSLENVSTETSTYKLAEELFHSSWRHNEGKTHDDLLFFHQLPPHDVFLLLDAASCAERLLEEFCNENEQLLMWNLAEWLYQGYVGHPLCSEPNLPFELAPDDLKRYWHAIAKDFWVKWLEVKHLGKHLGWRQLEIKK